MLLAIDTALASLSVAVFDGNTLLAAQQAVIGRGHAEALLPMVAAVMAEAGIVAAQAIVVTIGPGSFTGMRVGIAGARALGLAWGATVHGTTATALIAAAAFASDSTLLEVAAVVDAGRGQVCVQRFSRVDWATDQTVASLTPLQAAQAAAGVTLAGPAAAAVAALSHSSVAHHNWPNAADVLLLPPAVRSLAPQPLYVRPPDAKLPL